MNTEENRRTRLPSRIPRRRGSARPMKLRKLREAPPGDQGLTLVHFSAQPEPFLTHYAPLSTP